MTSKTAMQQMLEWVTNNYPNFNAADIEAKIEELLATEKQQEIKSYDKGFFDGANYLTNNGGYKTGEQYYTQTFGNSPSPSN